MQPPVTVPPTRQSNIHETSPRNNHLILLAVAVLALAGVVVSAISLQRHYAKSKTTLCDFGERFNCDVVNRSEYSRVMGIPVAGIGMAGYGAIFTLAAFYRSRRDTAFRLLLFALAGLVFALYLTYVEAYVLDTWCVLCIGSLALIASITALVALAQLQSRTVRTR